MGRGESTLQMLSEMDKESERLRHLLEQAQREGEALKARVNSMENEPESVCSLNIEVEERRLLKTLVNLVDSPSISNGEKAPSYAELMETAGVVTPLADVSPDGSFSDEEPGDDFDASDSPLAADAAARITIENIRSQARAYATEQPTDRIGRLLQQVKVASQPVPAKPINPRAATAAKQLLASIRIQAEEYAQEKAKERQAVSSA